MHGLIQYASSASPFLRTRKLRRARTAFRRVSSDYLLSGFVRFRSFVRSSKGPSDRAYRGGRGLTGIARGGDGRVVTSVPSGSFVGSFVGTLSGYRAVFRDSVHLRGSFVGLRPSRDPWLERSGDCRAGRSFAPSPRLAPPGQFVRPSTLFGC